MKAGVAFFAFGLYNYVLYSGTVGQFIKVDSGTEINETCGASSDVWSFDGSITLTPGHVLLQPKVVIQAFQEICSVDLTSCPTESEQNSDEACHCSLQTGYSHKIRVASQTTTSQAGMTLETVVPGHGVFQNIFGAATIGTPHTTEMRPRLNASYSMNHEIPRDLIDGQMITVCPLHPFYLEICVQNGLSDAELKIDLFSETVTVTGGNCIGTGGSFPAEEIHEILSFEYKEPDGCIQRYSIHFEGLRDSGLPPPAPSAQPKQIAGICPDTPRTVRRHPDGYDVLMDEVSLPFLEYEWTIFQRRVSDALSFNRSWAEYVEGFGDVTDSHWLGLEKIHALCNEKTKCVLLIHLQHPGEPKKVDLTEDDCYYVCYSEFFLDDATQNYKLHVDGDGIDGNAGDSLRYFYWGGARSNEMPFSTYDKDNNNVSKEGNCAMLMGGGWWFNIYCSVSNLNAVNNGENKGPYWGSLVHRSVNGPIFTEMKLGQKKTTKKP